VRNFGTNGVVVTDAAKIFGASSRDIINASALQSDGKLIVGGTSNPIRNFTNFALARYKKDGTLDKTFGVNGVVTTEVSVLLGAQPNTNYSYLQSLLILNDGKILAGGATTNPTTSLINFVLVRYNKNGSVDHTFGNNGVVLTDVSAILGTANRETEIYSIILHNNKIVVTGVLIKNSRLIIARYNLDGTLDTTFGTSGIVIDQRIQANIYNNVGFLTDDSIIVGGTINSQWAIAKYNPDGSLNTSFGTNGYVITNLSPSPAGIVNSIAIFNNKIIAAGFSVNLSGQALYTVIKYNSDGTLDTSFGIGGGINILLGNQIIITRIKVQSDGKIVTGGNNVQRLSASFAITRLTVNGDLDTTFGNGGVVTTNFGRSAGVQATADTINSLVLDSQENIFASGYTQALFKNNLIDTNDDFAIAKYNSNGVLDATFGNLTNGLSTTDYKKVLKIPGGAENSINATLTSGSQIITAGFSDALDPNYDFATAIYNSDGTLSGTINLTDFSSLVDFNPTVAGTYDIATSLALQQNGKFVVGGFTNALTLGKTFSFGLTRKNFDGSDDNSFGTNSLVITNFGRVQNKPLTNDSINSIAIQNNKIIAGGFTAPSNNDQISSFGLARYNSNGSLDNTFGALGKGIVITNFGQILNGALSLDQIASIAIQNNNKIVAGGFSTANNPLGDFALARYNVDGTLDTTFGNNGLVITNFPASLPGSQINSIAIQNDGKIVAGGITSNFATINPQFNFALARYNTNGTLDTTFGNNGMVVTKINPNGSNQNDQLNSLVITKNNKIIAGGTSNARDPKFDYVLVQYNSNGSIDTSVGQNGVTFTDFGRVLKTGTRSNDVINSVAFTSNGQIVAGGNSNAENINFDFALAKYNIKSKLPFTTNIFVNALFNKYGC